MPEICVNVTTVIKYLLPGSAPTDPAPLGPETFRSTFLLLATVVIAISSWPETATFAITLGSASRTSRSGRTGGLFVGGRDNFSWKV